jgi:A/G-specific adenine glycosylase
MGDVAEIRSRLLRWYAANRRALPWRARPGETADPYRVWLSEIMLQQTTVAHATPYFLTFTRRWPDVSALAAAPEAEIMAAWAGLGYYARARNLIACARQVSGQLGGAWPTTQEGLRALPGLGPYTAAAVAAIAFGRIATIVDTNVERVVARLYALETPLPAAKKGIHERAAALASGPHAGDWAQALMDLGATICRPAAPLCERCPLAAFCQARAQGDPAAFPRRAARAELPHRYGVAFRMFHGGDVALVRRPPKGLLGGMLGLPGTAWRPQPWSSAEALALAPTTARCRAAGAVEHTFTHFSLSLAVFEAHLRRSTPGFEWTPTAEARAHTPSVFAKALRLG